MKNILLIDIEAAVVANACVFANEAIIGTGGSEISMPTGVVMAPEGHRWFEGEGARGWTWDGYKPVEPPQPELTIADYQSAIQAKIDETARAKQFNDGVTLASYGNSTNALWAAQALAFIAWRDQVWTYCYSQLADVEAGQRPQPIVSELLGELPEITWPQL